MPIAKRSSALSGSVLVFKISIGLVDLFGRSFFRRYPVLLARPLAQINQFAPLAAKRTVGVACVFCFLVARRTLHGDPPQITPISRTLLAEFASFAAIQ